MKVIVHTEFDMLTFKAVGAAICFLMYAILAYKFPQIVLMVVCLISFFIGSLVWYLLILIIIKRNSLCFESRYSKNRPGFVSVTLSKRFKKIDYMEFELPTHAGAHNRELGGQVHVKLKLFFTRHLSDTSEFEIIQFFGCTERDANQISKLVGR